MVNNITDADLFLNYLNTNATVSWSDAQIEAATGYPTVTTLTTIGPGNAIRVKAQGGHVQRHYSEKCPIRCKDQSDRHKMRSL